MKATFSINIHNSAGKAYQQGLFIHLGDNVIIRFKDIKDLQELIKDLKKIKQEVEVNFDF